jgi:class 3 adenylate cyclase
MSTNEGVTRILNLGAEDLNQAAELEKLRRNITVLFTDLKGSTAYFEKFGDAAGLIMVHRCNCMLGDAVRRHGGRVIKEIGDAVMAAFEDHAEAVAASIEMQEAITADNAGKPEGQRIAVRIGINYGLGIVKSNDVYGDVVNVASRVESAAAPEQILISDTLYNAVESCGRFRLRAAGKFALKGKSEQRELYEVSWRAEDTATHPISSHSMVMPALDLEAALAPFRLTQVRTDGKPCREFELRSNCATIGRFQGEFTFPHDASMQSPHARVSVEGGQMFLEPIGDAPSFFSLIGPFRLQSGEIVKIGSQYLEFRVDTALMEMAANSGKNVGELSKLFAEPIAEFVSTGPERRRYPLLDQQLTFGRTKGSLTFPNDFAMSRSHAKVYQRGEDFFLEDIGSTNGTYVMAREKTAIPTG